jgi:hypothetical protein
MGIVESQIELDEIEDDLWMYNEGEFFCDEDNCECEEHFEDGPYLDYEEDDEF